MSMTAVHQRIEELLIGTRRIKERSHTDLLLQSKVSLPRRLCPNRPMRRSFAARRFLTWIPNSRGSQETRDEHGLQCAHDRFDQLPLVSIRPAAAVVRSVLFYERREG